MEKPAHPSFAEALRFWFRLGCISFGGPAGQIAIMHEFLVDKRRWISDSKFLHALNYCMLLPGPEAQQLATYIGWLLHGTRGGLVAGALFVLPSCAVLWVLSALYVNYGQLPAVAAIFAFLKPAVLTIVLGAVLKIGKKSLTAPIHFALAAAAFVAIYFLKIPFPAIIAAAILLGFVSWKFFPSYSFATAKKSETGNADESSYLINQETTAPGSGFSAPRLARQIGVAGLLWALPLLALFLFAEGFGFWKTLVLFFTQAALVTFGGAYAVLPYVAQVSVEKLHWLTAPQMVDGLALGETTPGPLIMVLAFVGFVGAHGAFGGSLAAATLGLVLTVFYTFLPSFLFILAGAPIIERTQANPAVRHVLQFVTAAVTGVVLNLGVYFGQAVLLPNGGVEVAWVPLVWAVASFVALQKFGVNMLMWLGISVLVGLSVSLLVG